MPYKVNWYDEAHSIIHVLNEGVNTWDELHTKYDEVFEVVMAADHRTDVIMEARNGMPAGNPLPHLQKIIAKWSAVPTLGTFIVISARRMERFTESAVDIAGMLTGVAVPEFVRFTGSVEDALAIIEQDRIEKHGLPTLAALSEKKLDLH
jgi:hypothetical protein